MDYTNPHALVSTEWLAERLTAPGVVVLDATSHLPTTGRDAEAEFAEQHIPGAIRFNIDDIADPNASLPHMLPDPALFAAKVGALGISNMHHVVVYDVYGLQSAARAWWMFRVFGHGNVSLLNGGLPKWLAERRPVESEVRPRATHSFTATFRPELVRAAQDLLDNVDSQAWQVADARAAGRFTGEEPEPRAGMRSGHIPGSTSLPFPKLLTAERTLRPAAQLQAAFAESGIDLNAPLVTTCGSGVTACVLALGGYLIGATDIAVYDGSWSEWGGRDDTPVATGAA